MAELLSTATDHSSSVVRKLGSCVLLSEEEVEYVESLMTNRVAFEAGEDIITHGEEMKYAFAVVGGTVMRSRLTAKGRRQILDFALSGDVVGGHIGYDNRAFATHTAVTPCEVAIIEPMRMLDVGRDYPVLAAGFQWNLIQNYHILGEHNVSLGARDARGALLSLLLEFWCRLMTVGEADMDGFKLVLTQSQLGDACGLTNVYVSRMLQELQNDGLLQIENRMVSFPNFRRAFDFADFDMTFLQPVPLRTGIFASLIADMEEQTPPVVEAS